MTTTNGKKQYPDKYWHISVTLPDKIRPDRNRSARQHDLTFEQVNQIITCWRAGTPFLVGGQTIHKKDVQGIKLAHTDGSSKEIARLSQSSFDALFEVFNRGTDYAQELLYTAEARPVTVVLPELELVLSVCRRVRHAAKVLELRRKGKEAYKIQDEYDVQDLLHAVLRSYFKYTVQEDPIPKLAGVSSRADFSIEDLGVIIEVKYARGPSDQERIVKEFAEDQQSYAKWEHLKHFIYVVYRSDDLKDPEALNKLAGAKSLNGRQFEAHIVLA